MPSKTAKPRHQQYPDLYAFNLRSKRYHLKSSGIYKRESRLHPTDYVEARSIHPDLIKGPHFPPPPPPPVIEMKTVIGCKPGPEGGLRFAATPTPAPPPQPASPPPPAVSAPQAPPTTTQLPDPQRMADNVRALIYDEIKANPRPYQARRSEEMEVLFRKMLIEKLATPKREMRMKTPQPPQSPPSPARMPVVESHSIRPAAVVRPKYRYAAGPPQSEDDELSDLVSEQEEDE